MKFNKRKHLIASNGSFNTSEHYIHDVSNKLNKFYQSKCRETMDYVEHRYIESVEFQDRPYKIVHLKKNGKEQ